MSLLLIVSSLFTSLFTEDAEPQEQTTQTFLSEAAEFPTQEHPARIRTRPARDAADRPDVDYADMKYTHCDPDLFYTDTEELRRLADAGDDDGVVAMYDKLYTEFTRIDAMTVLAMLGHDADIYDEYWIRENAYMSSLWTEVQDELLTACCYVMGTDCRRALSSHVGRSAAQLFRTYEHLPEDSLDAYDRELELIDRYYTLYDTIDDIEYSYLGETWTFNKLYGFPGTALYESDPSAYMTIYQGLHETVSQVFAPVYIELVELWTNIARSYGYDSYTDYAYNVIYWRDYSPEDAQRLCDAVKPIARAYYADLYYSDLAYALDEVSPLPEGDGLVALLGEYLPRIDDSLLEPWQYMSDHGLYDIQPAANGRYDGAYTTTMLYYYSPFLYASLEGSCQDLATITHEFGHYCDYYFNPMSNLLVEVDDLDLSEIHSNGLQALFTCFYGDIYKEGADIAEFSNLAFLLENVIDGCFYDEFQRRVLDDPEDLTAERINDIMTGLAMEYGMYDEPCWDGTWAYIPHNFEQPLYYFSYAASGFAALQIWDMAQTDFDGAADVYMDVLSSGSHRYTYFEVMENCGLIPFSKEGSAERICQPVLNRLRELDRAYY